MNKTIATIAILLFMNACSSDSAQTSLLANLNNDNASSAPMVEVKDYITLKRFRVIDNHGFNQPVEASSFLLPADWKVDGNIAWNATSPCLPEMVQANLQASSPNNDFELTVYPVTQLDWSDDPIYLDAMQRGFNAHACHISEPVDAESYIQTQLAPYVHAQVKSVKAIDELQSAMDAGAAQMTQTAQKAGADGYNHRGSAAEGKLSFADGKEGLAFCTVMQTILTMGGTQGNMANNYQCYVSMRIVLKYTNGKEDMARKIMSTFFSSSRINPQWWQGLQGFFQAVSSNAQSETWKQIQISHQAQQEIGNNIIRSWESKNSNTTSNSTTGDYTNQFGEYLRGVDNYTDNSGNKVELSSGYDYAWSKGDGTYVMSNNPAFDPNVTFQESWSRLSK